MQKTKIEWVRNPDGSQGYSWNPIKGICPVGCWYCYARKMYNRFHWNGEPRFMEEVWRDVYDPSFDERGFFVCSTFDLFHPITETNLFGSNKITWRSMILGAIEDLPQHRFYILTKFPQNIDRPMPDNVWLGVTVDKNAPFEFNETYPFWNNKAKVKFVSFEPLLERIPFNWLTKYGFDWIIVGRLTGYGHKFDPKKEWIKELVDRAKQINKPIFLKDNLKEIWGEPLIQEFPREEGMEELIKRLIPPTRSKEYAYKMGKDCAKNGANTTNCHFSIFSSKENTAEWERGKNEQEK